MDSGHMHDGDCASLESQLWDYLDGELSPERIAQIDAHLAMCTRCTGHVEFERAVRAAIRQARSVDQHTERLAARVRNALADAGFGDPR